MSGPHDTGATTDTGFIAVAGKTVIVWLAYLAGISLGEWVQLAALVYTVLQIGFLLRDRLWPNAPPKK